MEIEFKTEQTFKKPISRGKFNSDRLKNISHKLMLTLLNTAAAAAESLQSCSTLCDPIDGSLPGSSRPWDSPGKNTGVGCHFLLQCMKLKSESEVTQSCQTLCDPMDCSLPGSSDHGIFQARVLEWGAIDFSYIYVLIKVNWKLD